jgi:xanthine/CO dehydrogenase XdhC/CoxF family maturation factor
MTEAKAVARAAAELRRAGEAFLVATVVHVRGSAYRRPGARMVLGRDRWVAGSVSGGCLERDLVKRAWWLTRGGEPVVVTYDARDRDDGGWGFGLGCDGAVDVLIEAGGAPGRVDPLAFFERCRASQRRGAIATVFSSEHPAVRPGTRVAVTGAAGAAEVEADPTSGAARDALADAARAGLLRERAQVVALCVGDVEVHALIEPVRPPLRLYVLGAGHDALPVVELAGRLGWDVVVCEPSSRPGTRARFAAADVVLAATPSEVAGRIAADDRAACVVMGHDYERDRAYLAAVIATRAEYVGVLGPRRRTLRMLAELGAVDVAPRLHMPVGLDLGAESPQEIALAIVAEVLAATSGASGKSLAGRAGAVHANPLPAPAVAGE